MSFLDVLLNGYRRIQLNGAPLPPEPTLDFTGSVVVTDDPANTRTIVNIQAACGGGYGNVFDITSANGPIYTVPANTTGQPRSVLVSITALTAGLTVKLPLNEPSGSSVVTTLKDTSFFGACTLSVNGNGLNVYWRGTPLAQQTFVGPSGACSTLYDYGLSITWSDDGTSWAGS